MILSNSERGLAPTFDTPVGTVIRLTKGEGLLAKTGSLAVVSGAAPMYLKVNWIRDKRSGVQQDGNYRPANFEVFAFQVGDRVVTADGRYGTIEEFLTNKKARLRGAWTGNTLLVRIADIQLAPQKAETPSNPKKVTPDTPIGTVVRLINGRRTLARYGALAIVTASAFDNIKVEWIRDARAATQADGRYEPDLFEVFDFQIGDEVVTQTQRGTILGFQTSKMAVLSGVQEAHISDMFHADSLKPTPATAAPRKPQVGDTVVVDTKGRWPDWDGYRAVIHSFGEDGRPFLDPRFGPRPDGLTVTKFFWARSEVRAFDPDRDFRVGDTVHVENRGKRPFTFDGYYPLSWERVAQLKDSDGDGSWALARRLRLQPAPVVPRVPQPRKENWVFEAGQQIAHRDVLNDLPMGTVVIGFSYWGSPYVKLGRNRWGRMLDVIRAVEATDSLRGAADRGDAIIVYVPPTES